MKDFNSAMMGMPSHKGRATKRAAAMAGALPTDTDFGRLVSLIATKRLMAKAEKEDKQWQEEQMRAAADLANHKFMEKLTLARLAEEAQGRRTRDKENAAFERENRSRQWDLDKEARKEGRLDKYNKLRFAEKEASRERGYQEARDLSKDKQAARNEAFEQSLIAKSFADPMDYLKYKADPAKWSSKMVKINPPIIKTAWEAGKSRIGLGSSYKPKIKTKLKD
jgi:hypothetical protein